MKPFSYTASAAALIGAFVVWQVAQAPSLPPNEPTPETETLASPLSEEPAATYIEIMESCGPDFEGGCVNIRSGPGTSFPAVTKARNGMVLAVATTTVTDTEGTHWYPIIFTEWIRYPSRIADEWFVSAEYARALHVDGSQELEENPLDEKSDAVSSKKIVVDRSDQMLYAYDGDSLFLQTTISTGLDLTPTPRGTFTIFRKTPSRYMQGPLPGISNQYYDLPGVPWSLYFTKEGGAIHGAYWHTSFGSQWSHGCVNLPLDVAEILYEWAPLGTTVVVQD